MSHVRTAVVSKANACMCSMLAEVAIKPVLCESGFFLDLRTTPEMNSEELSLKDKRWVQGALSQQEQPEHIT
eukprot:4602442-Amphidinium_carterae.1